MGNEDNRNFSAYQTAKKALVDGGMSKAKASYLLSAVEFEAKAAALKQLKPEFSAEIRKLVGDRVGLHVRLATQFLSWAREKA